MIKLAVIVLLLLVGGLVMKYLDERSQMKFVLGLGLLAVLYIVGVMAYELMR
ncbi:hypothetical protein L4C36_02105 [Photobacterium japonica]|uniref:hypothetical protein n=1 Tax=Photobacterium japonica TaxID=2910235 RepID=UPI003D14DC5D